jgi:ribosomal protein S18 acetylase RimI-like enzyme
VLGGGAEKLGAMHVASWRETYAGLLPSPMLAGFSVEKRTAAWFEVLADPARFNDTAVYLAEDEGEVIGFGSCGQQRDGVLKELGFDGEISAIYILRSHQGHGLRRALMCAMAALPRSRSLGAATLWVLRENAPARGFYERLGGEPIAEKKDQRPQAALVEVAYGWRDLAPLAKRRA